MCQRVTCKTCGKATYEGCGMHVEQVLAGVPGSERCSCADTGSGAAASDAGASRGGLFSRLRGSRQR
jgi:hypothetical protein